MDKAGSTDSEEKRDMVGLAPVDDVHILPLQFARSVYMCDIVWMP